MMERLEADRDELARFIDATFRHADADATAILRIFAEGTNEVTATVRVAVDGEDLDPLIDHAFRQATKAARASRPAVFAPPVATFQGNRAREADLANGLVITVEADAHPSLARRNLEFLLGQATVVVASGGEWTDPDTGTVEPKLHLHWRCCEPSRSPDEHAALKQARALACAFAGADASAVSPVHPIRWPGSVHRKREPRLARIVALHPEVELDPSEAIELLQPVVPRGFNAGKRKGQKAPTSPRLEDGDLRALGEVIANPDRSWEDWNRLGLALFAASGGSDTGLEVFEQISKRSSKHDPDKTRRRWAHYHDHPPSRLTPGTLIYEARQADPSFRLPSRYASRGTSHDAAGDATAEEGAAERPEDPRPLIRVRGGGLADHTRDAERVLATQSRRAPFGGVYARGSLLVRPVRLRDGKHAGGIRQAPGSLILLPADADYLRLALTRHIHFERFDKRSEEWVNTDAPSALARSLLAAVPWKQMPSLAGIVEAPTLRPDGALLDRPGFDEDTGLLFDPGEVAFPRIPPRPSQAQARSALDQLLGILEGFPFADEASRSVAVAALITGLVRRSLRSAPLFAFTAPKMASGKSLLATCVAYLATGRPPAMMSQGDDAENERKRLFALLLEAAPIIAIDNLERPLASDALCSILTEPMFSDRLLGSSRTASVPTNALLLATGNNLILEGDLTTRALVGALDPQCERPEERRFEVNLHEAVPARRPELVAAALTIPLAYLAAGAPPQDVAPFGRFESWARWCRDPLLWLGMTDPCASRQRIEARDPVRGHLRAMLMAWHAALGEMAHTLADVVAMTASPPERADGTTSSPRPGEALQELRKALEQVAANGREVNTRRLGNFVSKHEGRVEDGLRFERGGDRSGVMLWKVVRVDSSVGFMGFVGSGPTPTRESPECRDNVCISDSYNEEYGPNPRNPGNPRGTKKAWESSL